MNYDQIFAKYDGKGINTDGKYGNQCKDWTNQFASEIGHPFPAGNAIDMAGLKIPGYSWTPYKSGMIPTKGCIVVWGKAVGQYGHIAVATGEGNAGWFKSYDQNWPLQVDASGNGFGVVHLEQHNYHGVLGWQQPEGATEMASFWETNLSDADAAQWIRNYGNREPGPGENSQRKPGELLQQIVVELLKRAQGESAAGVEAKAQVIELKHELDKAIADNNMLHGQVADMQKSLTVLTDQVKVLQDKLAATIQSGGSVDSYSVGELVGAIGRKFSFWGKK